jgi:hypothetical protein
VSKRLSQLLAFQLNLASLMNPVQGFRFNISRPRRAEVLLTRQSIF